MSEEDTELEEEQRQKCNFYSQIMDFAQNEDLQIFWVSAKTGFQVPEMFNKIVDGVFDGTIKITKTQLNRNQQNLSQSLQ